MNVSVQTGGILSRFDKETGYRLIREAGFDGIDWNIDQAWNREEIKKGNLGPCIFERPLDEVMSHYEEELSIIRKNGLKILQAHAPFPAYTPCVPELNEYAIRIYERCIEFCDRIGCPYLVIHGISLILGDDQTPESIAAMNHRLYSALIPVLQRTNVTVCMENLFTHNGRQIVEGVCAVPEEAVRMIDEMNALAGRECFALCLDTGHLNILGKNQLTYIRTMGHRLKALHLHDNKGTDDDHLMPFAGNIRWQDVLQGLKDIGYDQTLNFETFQQVEKKRNVTEECVPIFLKAIHDIGLVFADKIRS